MDPDTPKTPTETQTSATPQNRKQQSTGPHTAMSCLLLFSTALAALFCYLYITKPIFDTVPNAVRATPESPAPPEITPPPTPAATPTATAKAPTHAGLEETNLRVQHILTAESPGGRADRIELTVPVLYRSRHLLWSDAEVDTARQLMEKLVRYQEQSRALREEGHELLTAWNQLVNRALPSEALRADSPSLPSNQLDAHESPRPPGWTSNELIQIQAPEK